MGFERYLADISHNRLKWLLQTDFMFGAALENAIIIYINIIYAIKTSG
jgi:hypothetical protein